MKVLMSGAGGLVGSAYRAAFPGDEVTALVRTPQPGAVSWDPAAGTIDANGMEGFDAVIHLAGENIAGGRWSAARKARIRDSRIQGTGLLCRALAGLAQKPSCLISASAIGYYGNRYGEKLGEYSDPGKGFLAEVCRGWEDATQPAEDAGIRVVHARVGVILCKSGGALRAMLRPFKLGAGGKLGNGKQYFSWISIDDAVAALRHCIEHTELEGAVNVTAPNAVTNKEFTKTLGRVLRRPTILPMPGFAARLAFGEMATDLLLNGQRVIPERLSQTRFPFAHPELEAALRHVLA